MSQLQTIEAELRQRGLLPPADSAGTDRLPAPPQEPRRQPDAGGASAQLQAIEAELRQRGLLPPAPSAPPPNPFERVLREGGVGEADRQRLLRTGVTPGNAAEFAAAHIQERRAQGIEPSQRRQEAIFDIYKHMAGREDTSDQNFYQQQRTREIKTREETPLGHTMSSINALNQAAGATGTSILGLAAPETARRLQENVDATYDYRSKRAGFVGQGLSELANMVAAAPLGLVKAGGLYAARGAGGQRVEVDRLRSEGRNISGLGEAGTAFGVGAAEGLSGAAGIAAARTISGIYRGLTPTVRTAAAKGNPSAIRTAINSTLKVAGVAAAEGTEEAITELVVNAIRQNVNPEQALTEGLMEAFAMGAILGPIAGLGVASLQSRADAELLAKIESVAGPDADPASDTADAQQPRALPESTPEAVPPRGYRESTPEAVPPRGYRESRLTGQEYEGLPRPQDGPTLAEEAAAAGPRTDPPNPRSTFTPTGSLPKRRRKSKLYPEGFDERALVVRESGDAETKAARGKKKSSKPAVSKLRQTPASEVAAFAATISPREDGSDAAELGAEIEYYDEMVSQLKNGRDNFVEVRVPVDSLDTINTPDASVVDDYASRDGADAPPVVAGVFPNESGLTIVDGKHRAAAARARGDKTIRAMVPLSDAVQLGLVADDRAPAPTAERNPQLEAVAQDYAQTRDLPPPETSPGEINPLTARKLAKAYDNLVHDPNNPEVKASYDAFMQETLDQFNDLKSRGYVFDTAPVQAVANQYPTVNEVSADVRINRHLTINADPGDMPADHPLMEVAPGTGGLTYNQVFRAVHDIYGHAKDGYEFTIEGEENAWRAHSQMYTDLARGAMTTETRGQATWVGYGPHRDANRQKIREGKIGEVVFPPQKAALLPREFWTDKGLRPISDIPPDPQDSQWEKTTKKIGESASRARKSIMGTAPIEGTEHKRRMPRVLEDFITPLNERVRDISVRIFARLSEMDFRTGVTRERIKALATPRINRLDKALRGVDRFREFKGHLNNKDREGARQVLREINPDLVADLDALFAVLDLLLADQRDAGVTIGEIDGYWPRGIRNYEAFKKEYGDDTGLFEEAWELARKVKGKRLLTSEEKAEIANQVLQGYGPRKPGSYGPPHARTRRIDQIPDAALDHYVDPFEMFFRYVDGAVYAAERARFLGRNHDLNNLDETVGQLVAEEVEAGNISSDGQAELRDLLVTRFTADMLTTHKHIRNLKQIIYIVTLGQFRSALTQFTDLAITMSEHGLFATVEGIARTLKLTKADRAVMHEELGIHSHGEEFRDVGRVAKTTDWVLRATAFKAVDRFGKQSRINTARVVFERAAINPDGPEYAKTRRDYEPVLGEDRFQQAMTNFRQGKLTEDGRLMLFLDIMKIQPVSISQMPSRYLQNPNGRIFYTLKTFTIKQLDHIRRDMIRKILTPGQRREGLAHLARYLFFFTLIGMTVDWIKDWLRGQTDTESISDRALNAMLGAVGLNRYLVDQAYTAPTEAAFNFMAPPLSWIDRSFQDITSEQPGIRSIRNMPIIGELLYFWAPFGRGYHLNREQADRIYRKRLRELRSEAGKALEGDDPDLARTLLTIYNERRTEGPGDGRQRPLTLRNLRGDIQRREVRDVE